MVERGSPHSLPLMESGKLLPGVSVIIADPESKGQCGDSNLGEIWVELSSWWDKSTVVLVTFDPELELESLELL